MADEIATLTVKTDDQISDGAQAAADTLNNLANSADNVTASVTKVGPSFTKFNQTIDENAKYAAAAQTATARYQAGLAALQAEYDKGGISADQLSTKQTAAAAVLEISLQKAQTSAVNLGNAIAAASGATDSAASVSDAAAARVAAYAAAVAQATSYQTAFNTLLGVADPSADSYTSRAADIAAYGSAIDALRARYVPLVAAQQQLAAVLAETTAGQSAGALSASETADAQAAAAAAYRATAAAATAAAAAEAAAVEQANRTTLGIVDPDADTYAARAADVAAYGAAIDALRAKYVPLESAQQSLNEALAETAAGQAAGALSADEASAAQARAQAAYRATAAAATAAASAEAAAVEQANRSTLGISDPDAASSAARAADIEAYGNELDRLQAKYDPLYAAQSRYESTLEEINLAEKSGAISSDVAAVARDNATVSLNKAGTTANTTAAAHGSLSLATAGATREFIVMGDEILRGNYSRIPGSLLVLAERAGGLGEAVQTAFAAVFSVPGLIIAGTVAGVAALAAMSISAENASLRVIALQNTLRATTGDYVALGAAVEAASKQSSQSVGGGSVADTRTANTTIATALSAGGYSDSTATLTSLDTLLNDMVLVMGITLPQAATKLATAIADPAAAAKKAADDGLTGFNAQVAAAIKNMEDSGDRAGALTAYLAALSQEVGGATQNITPMGQALHDLSVAFNGTGNDAKTFGTSLGSYVNDGIVAYLNYVTALVKGLGALSSFVSGSQLGSSSNSVPFSATSPSGNNQLPRSVSNQLYSIAEQQNYGGTPDMSATQADFASRVAYVESKGQQNGPDGNTLTSSAGAQGIMQILPSTSAALGSDPTTASGNIDDGLKYISQLWAKYNGNPDLVAMAYNWGPANVDAFLAGTKDLPASVAQYASSVTGTAIASLPTSGSAPLSATGSPVVTGGSKATDTAAMAAYQSSGVLSTQIQKNQNDQSLLQTGINDAMANGDTATVNQLSEALAAAQGKATTLITAQQALAQAAADANNPLNAEAGATRDLASVANQFALDARKNGVAIDQTALLAAQTSELQKLTAAHNDAVAAINLDTAGQEQITEAYANGAQSSIDATNLVKAQTEARATAIPGTAEYTAQVEDLTAALNAQSAAKADSSTSQSVVDQQTQLAYLQQEIALVGTDSTAQAVLLAQITERNNLIKTYGSAGAVAESDVAQAAIANAGAIAQSSAALQKQQSIITDFEGLATQAFDQVGQALTTAFSTGAAVNWGTVLKTIIASVLTELAKLAVLQPILNSLFGTNGTTLANVGGLIGGLVNGTSSAATGAAGTAASAATSSSSLSSLGTVGTVGGLLYKGANYLAPGAVDSVESYLGIGAGAVATGAAAGAIAPAGGLVGDGADLADVGGDIAGDTLTPAVSTLGGTISGLGTTLSNAYTSATNFIGSLFSGTNDVVSAASDAASATGAVAATAAGAAVSNAIPFIGAAISTAFSLASGNYEQAGITAAATAAGAAIGTFLLPGIGTAAGAGIGAALASVASLFGIGGGGVQHPFSETDIDVSGGQLYAGATSSKYVDPTAQATQLQAYSDSLNKYLSAVNLQISNVGGRLGFLDTSTNDNHPADQEYTQLSQILPQLTFIAKNAKTNFGIAENGDLAGVKFGSLQSLQTALTSIANFADGLDSLGIQLKSVGAGLNNITIASVKGSSDLQIALNADLSGKTFANQAALDAEIQTVNQFVNGTMPSLIANATTIVQPLSSFRTGLEALMLTYVQAEQQATAYGLSITALTAAQSAAYAAQIATQQPAVDTSDVNVEVSTLRAQASISTDPTQTSALNEQADLDAFDDSAKQQVAALATFYQGIYGNDITTTAAYGQKQLALEQSLYYQRLAIQTSYNTASATADATAAAAALATQTQNQQTATSAITSITQFATQLQTGSSSPLSAKDQLSLAGSQFNAVAGAAQAGDYNSLTQVTGYAQSFLTASQAVNGSDAAYVADFTKVLNVLGSIGDTSADTLTASVYTSTTQDQTTTLVAALASLQAEVVQLRLQVQQGSMTPARIAA